MFRCLRRLNLSKVLATPKIDAFGSVAQHRWASRGLTVPVALLRHVHLCCITEALEHTMHGMTISITLRSVLV